MRFWQHTIPGKSLYQIRFERIVATHGKYIINLCTRRQRISQRGTHFGYTSSMTTATSILVLFLNERNFSRACDTWKLALYSQIRDTSLNLAASVSHNFPYTSACNYIQKNCCNSQFNIQNLIYLIRMFRNIFIFNLARQDLTQESNHFTSWGGSNL